MRTLKRFGALLLTGALMLSATACGSTTGSSSDGKMSAQERVAAALEHMKEIKSVEVRMDMDMAMKVSQDKESHDFTMKTTGVTSLIQEPMKAKMDMTIDMGELGKQETQTYMQQQDGKYMMYSNVGGTWTSYELPENLLDQYDAQKSMELYLKGFENAKESGTEEINGKQATKIEGEISGDAMKEMINATGVLQSLGSIAGSDAESLEKMFSDMGSLKLTLWINDDNELVKVEEDLKDMITKMIENATPQEMEGMKIEISKAMMTGTYDKINSVENFELPKEAESATPLK